jgi:hypothetical protein
MLRMLGAGAALTFLTVAAPWSGGSPREVSASTAAADFVRGDVMILSSLNGRDVIVALDAVTPDGISDRVFRLQRNDELDASLSRLAAAVWLHDAALRFDRRSVQVVHRDFSASLLVEGAPYAGQERFGADAARSVMEFQAVLTGYSLQRSGGGWEMSVAGLRAGEAQGFPCGPRGLPASFATVAGLSFNRCSAGGEGATQCSIEIAGGSCSVSCGNGYYACCNVLGGCKCNPTEVAPPP